MTQTPVSGAMAASLFAAAFLWGANFPLAHLVVGSVTPMTAAVGRFAVAALVMLAVAAIRREPVPLIRHLPTLGVLSLVGIVAFNVLFFGAMQRTTAANGALIMATNPLLTAVLAGIFLGERVGPRHLTALPIALGGVIMVILGGGAGVSLSTGDLLMLGADLSWASYNVMARRLMPAGSPLSNMTVMMTYSAIGLLAAALVSGDSLRLPGMMPAAVVAAMGTLGTVVAYFFYNNGIAALGAGRAALFLNSVPVWAMAISALMGHPPSSIQITGGAIVLTAVGFASLPRRTAVAVALD